MKPEKLMLFFLLVIWSQGIFAQQEKIFHYDTEIEVLKDRSIIVTETIDVYAAGVVIKRGLTRSLPSKRKLKSSTISMNYEILEVEKDNQPEPYRKESSGGDEILYIGRGEVFLAPGRYTYKIKYRVTNQIAFFDDYDEIYWNAIGNDVSFVVENASCQVRLPKGAAVIQESANLGTRGQTNKDFTMSITNGVLEYRTARGLRPGEAFTVGVGFEKGFVSKPNFFHRYGTLLIVLLGLLFLFPYYIYTWYTYGQDPPTPASYPMWESPDGLSAASINYLLKGRYRNKSFTATVIDLAIKGYLKIEEVVEKGFLTDKKFFELIKIKESDDQLPQEEKELLDSLFINSDRVSIKAKYDPIIEEAYGNHKASLAAQHDSFITKGHNYSFLWLPILVTLGVGVLAVFLLIKSPYAEGINIPVLAGFALTAIIGIFLYGYLIKRPSEEKLDLRSKIKGFKMYLEMAEKDRLRLLNPPEMTPEHFERALPFAFALGVEHKWSTKFKDILEKAQYRPEWNNTPNALYFSHHFGRDFTKSLGAAAVKPPPSGGGSGSGGGGFAGGGGGGGGVGGW